MRSRRSGGTNGFVLIAVLVVTVLSSMVVASLMYRIRAEQTATAASSGQEQAWWVAMSGLKQAMGAARGAEYDPVKWQDDPGTFRHQLVMDDGADKWYFTLYAPGDEEHPMLYGLTDEASRANINKLNEGELMKLPGMTSSLAGALVDYVDEDSDVRAEGAEQEDYDELPQPYRIRNGRLETLDELLMVRGWTANLLYGEDVNRNNKLDVAEDDGDKTFPPDDGDGRLNIGLWRYCTVWSYDWNVDAKGRRRVNLMSADESLKGLKLPEGLGKFMEAVRAAKATVNHPLDLVGMKIKVKDAAGAETEIESGLGVKEIAELVDRTTSHEREKNTGLVNVNTATAKALEVIEGIGAQMSEAIVAARGSVRAERRRSIAWLLEEGVMDLETFKKVGPRLTARSYQFHAQIVAYGLPSGRHRIFEAVFDTAGSESRVVYMRELTRLGLPFKFDPREN